jgi:hypothetical protein
MAISLHLKKGSRSFKEKKMKTEFTKEKILAAAKKFLSGLFGDDIPKKRFWGAKLGLGIARELGVRVSKTPEGLDRAISALRLNESEDWLKNRDNQDIIYHFITNCSKIVVDTSSEELEVDETYLEFLQTGNVKMVYLPNEVELINMQLFPEGLREEDIYLDPIQVKTIQSFLSSKKGKMRRKGREKILLDLGWIKVLGNCEEELGIFDLVCSLISASKTQKRNIELFSSRRGILHGNQLHIAHFILQEKTELSKEFLQSLRRLCYSDKGSKVSCSAWNLMECQMPFSEWQKVISYTKKHKYKFVWDLLTKTEYRNFQEFKELVSKTISEKSKHNWERKFPTLKTKNFMIEEIVNELRLHEEGAEQGHCVGSFSYDCQQGRAIVCSVKGRSRYTLSFEVLRTAEDRDDLYQHLEVNKFYLTQLKGKFNQRPLEEDYWEVINALRASPDHGNLVMPEPGSEMVW